MLVFRDCDVERTLAGALWGSFTNCGQVCSGAERIYVERPLYKRFTEQLAAAGEQSAGRARQRSGRRSGPADHGGAARPHRGARRRRAGERRHRSHGRRPAGGRAARMVLRADGAVRRAHGGPRHRGGAVRAGGHHRAVRGRGGGGAACERLAVRSCCERLDAGSRPRSRISAALDAGLVWTNDISYSYYFAQAPWGGRKSSGYGRTHGLEGLRELVSPKYVDSDSGRVAVPWWYPYRARGCGRLEGWARAAATGKVLSSAAVAPPRSGGLAHLTRRFLGHDDRGLSHLDESGRVHMVDVGGKPMQRGGRRRQRRCAWRRRRSSGSRAAQGRRARLRRGGRHHGRQADERPDPALPSAPAHARERQGGAGDASVEITAVAETTAQTGVEMEALTAASVAALALYDMVKGVDAELVVEAIRLVEKTKS